MLEGIDPDDVIRITRWAIATKHRDLASYAARRLRMSWSDFAQEAILRFYENGHRKLGQWSLSVILTHQARWTIHRLLLTEKKRFEDADIRSIPGTPIDWDDMNAKADAAELWAKLRCTLHQRHREILELRFGVSTGEPYTLEECGRIYRITRESIRQIERTAIARCQSRRELAIGYLADYGRPEEVDVVEPEVSQ